MPRRWIPRVLLAGCLLAGAAPSQAQPAVAVFEDGTVVAGDLQQVEGGLPETVDHLWVWRQDLAPVRIGGEDLPFAAEPSKNHLVVRLPPGSRKGWELLAAPAAMWLEVPESRIPRWRVPDEGAARLPMGEATGWTLRLLAPGRGSWWTPLPEGRREVDLGLAPAEDRIVRIVDGEGDPIPTGSVSILVGAPGTARQRMVARENFQNGEVALPSLPDEGEMGWVLNAEGHAPGTWSSLPSALPPTLVLETGVRLSGRFVDRRGVPLPGVQVVAESWLGSGTTALARREARSDGRGRWTLEPLPPRQIAWTARKPGYLPIRGDLEPGEMGPDLGTLRLLEAASVRVRVMDDLGIAVPGARLGIGSDVVATADGEGRAMLETLPPEGEVLVEASAPGHVDSRAPVVAGDEERVLVLRRALTLTGELVDGSGRPPVGAAVVLRERARSQRQEVSPSGRFELDVEPARALELVFSSPTTGESVLQVDPGSPGEVRHLGTVTLRSGRRVEGRVWSTVDQVPLAGARIWAPRHLEDDAALAWVRGELLATTSDGEGRFSLQGLPPRPVMLRIEAPRHARHHHRVAPPADEPETSGDLGDIPLGPGGSLEVRVEDTTPSALARVDLRGSWQEMDMLTAPVVDGVARFHHVPPEEVLVTVLDGREVRCEESIRVESEELTTLDCAAAGVDVEGSVWIGERSAGAGTLSWRRTGARDPAAVIVNHTSPAGARQQRLFGAGRPPSDVPVDPSGFYQIRGLAPGPWEVAFLGPEGGATQRLSLEVPAEDVRGLDLRFDGVVVTGETVDAEGAPLPGVQVTHVGGSAHAISDDQGRFALLGVPPGPARLYGRLRELRTAEVVVDVGGDSAPDPVRLVLDSAHDRTQDVLVVDGEGSPVSGALVVVQEDGGRFRILTTDHSGRASRQLDPPDPGRVAAAVLAGDRWVFTGWRPFSADGVLEIATSERTGDLLLVAEEGAGPLTLHAVDAGEITPFLQRVGMSLRLEPGRPLRVAGLPAGSYIASREGVSRNVLVEAGEETQVRLP